MAYPKICAQLININGTYEKLIYTIQFQIQVSFCTLSNNIHFNKADK
jgi:hypothetical protein